ncbi:MAG: glucose-1-phosphate cytidylyltransferase [Fimbriimonadaceae bacterium]|nr:glucose-1-phosphate cytidylyltransferase [Alphaproteobacteria bacterium]
MKAVILAGGFGTRLSEDTDLKPKPMVQIGDRPILWHIMKIYAAHGITDFIICLGYKSYYVKEYFYNYWLHTCDVTFDFATKSHEIHKDNAENWRVTLIDTGLNTMTGGRLARVRKFVEDLPYFHMTYGDGVGDVDITALTDFHKSHGRIATLTATQAPGRFGALKIEDSNRVQAFQEKPEGDGAYINGGFFCLSPKALDYITQGDSSVWERDPLEALAKDGQLSAFKHEGFWQPMDTLRDKIHLNELWNSDSAPWKIW